ncbi:hypothetical protein T492DRAFT_850372 [Pavlovales sp. CCMP2436]|nr:hypothetical protein T492DRAFT_850372 [Pavlovales sp. CCMP2436]
MMIAKVHAGKRTDELRAKWRICREAPRLQTLSSPLDTELAESLYRECIFPFDSSFTPNPKYSRSQIFTLNSKYRVLLEATKMLYSLFLLYRVLLEATTMLAEFAGKHFLPFLQTDESDAVFSYVMPPRINLGLPVSLDAASQLLWSDYKAAMVALQGDFIFFVLFVLVLWYSRSRYRSRIVVGV